MQKNLIIFTDGSTCGNGQAWAYGGIGIFFPYGDALNICEPYLHQNVTNNRCELYAIYFALGMIIPIIKKYKKVIIYSDSHYSIDSLTKWIHTWRKNEWKDSKGKPVSNQDLIKPIYKLLKIYPQIKFIHVRSHTHQEDFLSQCNDTVDKLAVRGGKIARLIQQKRLKKKVKRCKF
jgi:ribonuclease HI